MLKPITALSENTLRNYRTAQRCFSAWCKEKGIRAPWQNKDIAAYLRHCNRVRGNASASMHLAALGHLYRTKGKKLDTKAPEIRRIVSRIRDSMRKVSA